MSSIPLLSTESATQLLLRQADLSRLWGAFSLQIEGSDPVVSSSLRYGSATTSALAAYALSIAELWRLRTGRFQEIELDLRRAVVCGLRSVFLLKQNGHGFSVGGNGQKINNFFRTKDQRLIYLLRMFDYPHLVPALLGVLRCPNEIDAIAEVVSDWNAFELEEALSKAKAIGVVSRAPNEWLSHPQGMWLAQRPGFHIQKIGESSPEPLPDGDRPLSGLKVLDASHVELPAFCRPAIWQGSRILIVGVRLTAPS